MSTTPVICNESVLIIDDDEQVVDVLRLVLEGPGNGISEVEGYQVESCQTPERALAMIARQEFSLILLDLRLGVHDGLELLPKIRELDPNVPVFMITAHGDVDSAVKALTTGATGYIKKPFSEGDLRLQVDQAIADYRLRREIRAAPSRPAGSGARELIRTRDPVMESVIQRIEAAARVPSSVVITGESGTGKELAAKALHSCGPRKDGPFVAFNCAALPESLLESELFGYMRGAFTDARESKQGLFTRANKGTLFIDEVGDAPLSIQAKLLRVLQEREVLPVGGTAPIKVDVRVVAATHRDLGAEVAAGRFRQDLYYRLHVVSVRLPALRERPKDILYLATLFANRIAGEMGTRFEGFTRSAEEALEAYDWPGNVRELQNRVEQALAIHCAGRGGGKLSASALFPDREPMPEIEAPQQELAAESLETPESPDLPTFGEAKKSFERTYLVRVLSMAKGNISRAAQLAAKSRTEVYALLRKHQLQADTFKE